MSVVSRNFKRKRDGSRDGPLDLEAKVTESGGDASYGLEVSAMEDEDNCMSTVGEYGIYGGRRSVASKSVASLRHRRSFPSSKTGRRPSTGQRSRASSARNPYGQSSSRMRRSSLSRMDSSVRSQSGRRTPHGGRLHPVEKAAVHVVCAVGENLARETCVASLDAGTPICLQVTKQGNGQTYAETIAYLEMLQPDEVLLNEGRRNSHLAKKILELFSDTTGPDTLGQSTLPGGDEQNAFTEGNQSGPCKMSTVVKFISRSCFDQTKGAALLRRLARQDTYDASLVEEYTLLSSAHAVLHYTQQALGVSFGRKCLEISVNSGGKNRMAIDRSTIMQLELLSNAKTGKTRNTLISTIDCTKTTVGSRLLRTNLIAPPCRVDTINSRLDLVDTFLEDEDFFYSVLEHLESLPAVDKMLTNVAVVPRKRGGADISNKIAARLASKGISALVCIKSTLTALPALGNILNDHLESIEQQHNQGNEVRDETSRTKESDDTVSAFTSKSGLLAGLGSGPSSSDKPGRNQLLKAIIDAISRPDLAEIQEKVTSVFTPSTNFSRNANAMRHQECFALKSADNGMMDVIRKTFLANVDDIYKKADEYAELHSIHVSVKYSASRGYYLSIPAELASGLPNNFIQPTKSGKFIHCTTQDVQSLNIRAQDNVQDLLLMTSDKIHEVLDFARSKYDALASLSDAVALLDLCHSFADNVTLSKLPWCRPTMTLPAGESNHASDGSDAVALAIRNGRYAIDVTGSFLASADGPHAVIPNDTFAKDGQCFTVITGINGSGKSTYLKQVGIVVLLAHCGSYVPAEHASIPLRTRLCARMGTFDDQENNISSFMLEMNETAFLCNNSSSGALILIDELGRATGNQDGLAIAWAVAEFLLSKQAMTFFVTHYPQLCRLADVYASVQNQHLQAAVPTSHDDGEIQYTHKVEAGPCISTPDYGIGMASSCGWPRDTLAEAQELEATLQVWLDQHSICVGGTEQLLEQSRQERAASSFQKEWCQKLVESVQSGSSISSLRSLLQTTFEESATVYASAARNDFLVEVGGKVDHSNIHSGPNCRTPLGSANRSRDSLPDGADYTGDSQNQYVSEEGIHRFVGLPYDRVSRHGPPGAARSRDYHCDHWESSDASSSLSSSDSLSDVGY